MTIQVNGTTGIDTIQDNTVSSSKIVNGAVTPADTQVGALPSSIIVVTGNGNGSTNTFVKRFTTTLLSQGSDVTYTASATNGDTFTINTSGTYAVSYSDAYTIVADLTITANGVTLTINPGNINDITRVTVCDSPASAVGCCSASRYFSAGTVIRAQNSSGTQLASGIYAQFTITRVA